MTGPSAASEGTPAYTPWKSCSRAERTVLVIALYFVAVSSYMDRFVLAILQEPIRHEFGLSDTQLGLMSGFAFAVLYATLGLPIARWADHGNRRTIITLCMSVWSFMTALCGMAQSFVQLLLARVGVGIGEAGTLPPSYSLIADYFPPEGRSTALAVFTFGSSSGVALGLIGGGLLAAEYGWRVAFLAVGVPGLVLALLFRLFVKEPRDRVGLPPTGSAGAESMGVAIRHLRKKHAYIHLVAATTIYFFIVGGAVLFLPPHLIRALHVPMDTVGLYYGLTTTAAAGLGALIGGRLADRMSKRDIRWMVRFPAIAMVAVHPLFIAFLMTDNFTTALGFYFVAWAILTMGYPPIFAAVQGVAGPSRRATAIACMFLVSTLVGNGLGPVVTGMMSDMLAPQHGVNSLRYSLMIVFALLFWSAWHFWRAQRWLTAEFEDQLAQTAAGHASQR